MDCKLCRENIHDFIKDNLTPEDQTLFHAHLEYCTECRREVDQEKNLSAMMNQWEVPKLGKGFDIRLNERLAEPPNRAQNWFRRLFSMN